MRDLSPLPWGPGPGLSLQPPWRGPRAPGGPPRPLEYSRVGGAPALLQTLEGPLSGPSQAQREGPPTRLEADAVDRP